MDYYIYLKLCVISTFEDECATHTLFLSLMKSAPPTKTTIVFIGLF